MASNKISSVDFEVFGLVQGVFFRKYTCNTAQQLGLVGWCKNTESGTVTGTIQGRIDMIMKMKSWLEKEGSPKSKIKRCDFRNECEPECLGYESFTIIDPAPFRRKRKNMAVKKK